MTSGSHVGPVLVGVGLGEARFFGHVCDICHLLSGRAGSKSAKLRCD